MNFVNIKKILVIKLRYIGDVLLAVPVFRALKETFPDAHISALVNSGTEDALRGNPMIDEIISFDRNIKNLPLLKRYFSEIGFLGHFITKGFNMAVDLTGGDRAAVISIASGAKYRLGWKSKKGFIGKRYAYTHLSEPDGNRHTVLQNMEVISRFGIDTKDLSIDFHIPEEDRVFIGNILKGRNIKDGDTVVHVHPTSRWLFKCWEDEYMAEIITWLLGQGIKVIVTSSPDKKEMEKAKRILSLVGDSPDSRLIDLCGKTTIKQLGAVSGASDLFFGVDSAPMHIAAAVSTPVIALFGPSGTFNWGPWDNKISNFKFQISNSMNPYQKRNGIQAFGMHTVMQRDWECIPCGKDGCKGTKISRCLTDISPEEVKNIIVEKLKI
ncbi:MAG: putative lipopolysaccharide heptosyltransferase III [Nitrospirae bacterium]|nr:putative lipopolysaccharide heptosyltransferase III [Nitrospirota bacterium]MCL5977103.1 putative lipopolysaccharide heptosyltransferase III [Nitrospirota bacterium]